MPGPVTLITGGVKSGKSAFGLNQAAGCGRRRSFIATATAGDEEMERKIAAHKRERGTGWATFEEPCELAAELHHACADSDVVLVDCLTMWVSNLLTLFEASEAEIREKIELLAAELQQAPCPVFIITNEVGMGIMPAESLSRKYLNLLGLANKRIAELSKTVYLIVAGIPVKIK